MLYEIKMIYNYKNLALHIFVNKKHFVNHTKYYGINSAYFLNFFKNVYPLSTIGSYIHLCDWLNLLLAWFITIFTVKSN